MTWKDGLITYLMAEIVGLRKWATTRLLNWARPRVVDRVRRPEQRIRLLPRVTASGVSTAHAEPFGSEAISESLTNVAHSEQIASDAIADGGTVYPRLVPGTA